MAKQANGKVKSVFVNSEGETITQDQDIAEAYRQQVNEAHDIETGLSDEQIVAIVRSIPGDESDETKGAAVTEARLQALRDASEREELEDLTKPPSAIDSPLGALAAQIGSKIDVATDNIVDVAVDNKEKYDGAPLEIADHLNDLFGGEKDSDGDILRCTEIASWPVPGSNQKNMPAGSNVCCDRYTFTDRATGNEHKGHFVGDIHDSTPHGIEIKERLAAIRLLDDDPTSGKVGFGYKTKFLTNGNIDTLKVEAEKRYWLGRRTSRINRIGRAIKFIQVVTRLHDDLKDVAYFFLHDDRSQRYRSNKPVKLTSGSGKKSVNIGPFGLSQVLALKIDEAIRNGGTLAALHATLKRKKKTDAATQQGGGKDKEGVGQALIVNAKQVEQMTNALVLSFNDEGGDRLLASLMADLQDAKSPEGKERILTFCEAVKWLSEIDTRIRPLQMAILQERTEQAAKDLQAKGIDPKTGKRIAA
jgi:hypothetical protein